MDDRAEAPAPAGADDVAGSLLALRAWAGAPSFTRLAADVSAARRHRGVPEYEARVARSTVYDCFRPGRRRLDADLVLEVATALGATPADLAKWRRALREFTGLGYALATVRVDTEPPVARHAPVLGREPELELIAAADESVLVTGMAGVGKTAVADETARRIADEFDAVLRVNLDGFAVGRAPAQPTAVRDALLRMGRGGPVPVTGADEALTRMLRERRLLVVLDNARDAAHVQDLIPPPGGPSRAVVTSRVDFSEELGLTRVVLGPLPPGPAAAVIRAASRDLWPADQLLSLADALGGVPLALVLAGQRLRSRPHWELVDHVAAVDRQRGTLSLDDQLELSLRLSYEALDEDCRRALRLLAQVPGSDVSTAAAAAVLDTSPESCRAVLRALHASNMLSGGHQGRHEMHDLVRVFAAQRSVADDPPSAVEAALDRLLDHVLRSGEAAMTRHHPHTRHGWWWSAPHATSMSEAEASEWFAAERANVIVLAEWAMDHDRPRVGAQLAHLIAPYLWEGPDAAATVALQRRALHAVETMGDEHARTVGHRMLGQSLIRAGQPASAQRDIQAACDLADRLGLPVEQVRSRNALALLASSRGDVDEAIRLLEEAVQRIATLPEDEFIAGLMLNLGVTQFEAGRGDEATATFLATIDTAARVGSAQYEQWASNNLIELLVPAGRLTQARHYADRALLLARQRGDEVGEAYALSNVPQINAALGDLDGAVDLAQSALAAARRLDHAELESLTLCALGDLRLQQGRPQQARPCFEEALQVAEQVGVEAHAERARAGLSACV